MKNSKSKAFNAPFGSTNVGLLKNNGSIANNILTIISTCNNEVFFPDKYILIENP